MRYLLFLLIFLVTACEGRPRFMYPTVPAERYFASSPALPAALACQHDDATALTQALAQAHLSPDAVGEQGMSLLLAMSNRSLHAVQALLDHGANPNLHTRFGREQLDTQPVALAAGGDNTPLLTLLLDHGGDPNSHFGSRPATFCAADADRYDHLRMLLDHGVNINITDKDGTTLMLLLAGRREFNQVAYLIKRGGDVHKADGHGGTVAFEVQTDEPDYLPKDSLYHQIAAVKNLLEARGVTFPVPHPGIAFQARVRAENAQRRTWEATTNQGRWFRAQVTAAENERTDAETKIYAAGGNLPAEDARAGAAYAREQQLQGEAEPRFQAWRKTQPNWSLSPNDHNPYPTVPTREQEAADLQRQQAALAVPPLLSH